MRRHDLALTADVAVFSLRARQLEVLLVRRRFDPFAGRWALPGGFVEADEDLEEAARRELAEETGVRDAPLEAFGTFGRPGRDPRGRTVTAAYLALVPAERLRPQAADDAEAVDWFPATRPPPMAFDHNEVLAAALAALRRRLASSDAALALLGEEFTVAELRALHEALRGRPLDAHDLRVLAMALDAVEPTGATRLEPDGPAALYRRRSPLPLTRP